MLRDQNLFYHVNRGGYFPTLKKGEYISDEYKKTGKFNNEASIQGYGHVGGQPDANIFFRRREKRLQPILRKRTFKDLDPLTRVIGRLDLTKKEKQATSVITSLQGLRDMISNFIRTPKLHPDGTPVINPRTGEPEFEMRTLDEIVQVSHSALFEALKKNNVVPNPRIANIILSFNSINIGNVLQQYQMILATQPAITQANKDLLFTAAIVAERAKKLKEMPVNVEAPMAAEVDEGKDLGIPDNWDDRGAEIALHFPTQGYRRGQWDAASPAERTYLGLYILGRMGGTANRLRDLAGNRINMSDGVTLLEAGNALDLDSLQFFTDTLANAVVLDTDHPDR